MGILKRLWVLAFAAAAVAAAQPRAERDGIEEVMRLSGLWTQLGQIEPQMQASAADAQARSRAEKDAAELDDLGFAQLRRAIAHAYAPGRLRRDFSRDMERELTPADRRAALDWLRSELGKRLTAMEERSGEAAGYARRQAEARELLPTLGAARVALVKRMMKSVDVVDFSATIMIDSAVGVAYGVAMSMPVPDVEALAGLKERFESQRPQIVAQLEPQMLADFAYIYREVGDAELERYVAFAESKAGRRYHGATLKVFDAVLSRAAAELGREMARTAMGPRRRS